MRCVGRQTVLDVDRLGRFQERPLFGIMPVIPVKLILV
jgi:hypothetical protein